MTNDATYAAIVTRCSQARARVRAARTLAEADAASRAWEAAEAARVAWLRSRA